MLNLWFWLYIHMKKIARSLGWFFLVLSFTACDKEYTPLPKAPRGFKEIYQYPHRISFSIGNTYFFPKPEKEDQVKYWKRPDKNNHPYIIIPEDGWLEISCIWYISPKNSLDTELGLYIEDNLVRRIQQKNVELSKGAYGVCSKIYCAYLIHEKNIPVRKNQSICLSRLKNPSILENLTIYFKPKKNKIDQ